MKKICLLASHLLSGSINLSSILQENSRIEFFSFAPYNDISAIMALTEQRHKLANNAAIYMDHLLYNHDLQIKNVYNFCRFIYVIRRPTETINAIVNKGILQTKEAIRYYDGRLRRLCEMAKRTPNAILLTWDDLVTPQGLKLIEKYLDLREPLRPPTLESETESLINSHLLREAEQNYQVYMSFLRQQKLQYIY